jgi:hypothetical protein
MAFQNLFGENRASAIKHGFFISAPLVDLCLDLGLSKQQNALEKERNYNNDFFHLALMMVNKIRLLCSSYSFKS